MTRTTQQPTTPKRTRTARQLGAGEASDFILRLRKAQQSEVESAYAELIAKHKARQAEREARILARCVDPERAKAILALETE